MPTITALRLYNQKLLHTPFKTLAEIVTWMGAVQAQDYAGAKWALALRLHGITDTDIDQALAQGSIIRTHVMRPTWHFVTPDDIRWMLDLTASRVVRMLTARHAELGLDESTVKRSNDTLAKALQDGQPLIRTELAEALEQVGISTEGQRLAHLLMRAEMDQILCSGGRRGKQFTYALLDERAPVVKRLARDEAVATLTRRYFTSHGPATPKDFAWWSGLTVTDAKAGFEMLKPDLVEDEIDGKRYWRVADQPDEIPTLPVLLLPAFDEYTVAYPDHSVVIDPAFVDKLPSSELLNYVMVVNGRVMGRWKRTLGKHSVQVNLVPFRPLTADEWEAFAVVARRYSEFLGLPLDG
jgi:hypothetical protein